MNRILACLSVISGLHEEPNRLPLPLALRSTKTLDRLLDRWLRLRYHEVAGRIVPQEPRVAPPGVAGAGGRCGVHSARHKLAPAGQDQRPRVVTSLGRRGFPKHYRVHQSCPALTKTLPRGILYWREILISAT